MQRQSSQLGFTYIGLLFAIVLIGILLSAAGTLWHTEARREKEMQLLFAGSQYQQAIASYHAIVFNGQQQFPHSLDELLQDQRFAMPVHHLRRRFVDPITNSSNWGMVRQDGQILAVFSNSPEVPLKQAGFDSCHENFAAAKTYADWKFVGTTGCLDVAAAHAKQMVAGTANDQAAPPKLGSLESNPPPVPPAQIDQSYQHLLDCVASFEVEQAGCLATEGNRALCLKNAHERRQACYGGR